MSHGEAYREGKISLKTYRRLQGLKLAGLRGSKSAMRKYRAEEKRLGLA